MTQYDVVVIGSGLGGLISGLILSKEGMKVCVLEQHHKVGGNLQTFSRDGCIFDTGMHYLGSMDEGQYLHKYFKYFGIADSLNLIRLDQEGYDTISFDGDETEYQLAQGIEHFIPQLLKYFPEEKKGLDQYIKEIKSVVNNFPLYNVSNTKSYKIDIPLLERCALGLLNNVTKNERLRNVLAGAYSLYAGHPQSTPLYIHACTRYSLISSSWRPVDGSQQIADQLANGIKRNGGSVLCSQKVSSFEIEDEQAKAVITEKGEKFFAKQFISNAHPVPTLNMIGESKIKKAYRKRLLGLENTWGMFSVYCVLKKDSLPYLNKNYFHYNEIGILGARNDDAHWPDNFYFYTPASSNTEAYAESIVVMADMKFDEMEPWVGTRVNQRGTAYKDFKARKAELLLDALEKRLPGIRAKVHKYYSSTPLTFQDYTATREGSAYGIMKDCHDPLRSIILPRTKISNILFTGQNLNLHGVLGVSASAVITCSEILGLQYLTNKISNG